MRRSVALFGVFCLGLSLSGCDYEGVPASVFTSEADTSDNGDAGNIDAAKNAEVTAPDADDNDANEDAAGSPDVGMPDAGGEPDAGMTDAGEPDAGITDAGEPDAEINDAGVTDAGVTDAEEPDAGTTDAEEPDAETPDAGELDAGMTDTGEPDAGTADAQGGDSAESPDTAQPLCTKAQECNDGVSCTADTCDPLKGCVHTPVNTKCDDNIPCTTDTCDPLKGCVHTPVNTKCDDNIPCTTDTCSLKMGCLTKANNDVCADGNECTKDECALGVGCTNSNKKDPTSCDDGNQCSIDDSCSKGTCVAGSDKVCTDSDPCTSGLCELNSGNCIFQPLSGTKCDDGVICTINDVCSSGKCGGKAMVCDDQDACTSGEKCIDNGAGKPICSKGVAKVCDDSDPCTSDLCELNSGNCIFQPLNGTKCDDGVICTINDVCSSGKCGGKAMVCDDQDACTSGEKCIDNGAGKPICSKGVAKVCDDSDPCTADSCEAKTGKCIFTPIPNCVPKCKTDADCDDGDACTTNTCVKSGCQNKVGNEGGFCAVGKVCQSGKCAPSNKGWAKKVSGDTYGRHFCALGTDTRVYCWGEGSDLQLGTGYTAAQTKPKAVPGLVSVQDVVACGHHSCAKMKDVWYCWGNNDYGELGTGKSGADVAMPTPVTVKSGIQKLTCGGSYSCGLLSNGKIWCWGRQSQGRLGNGSTADSGLPTGAEVTGLANVTDLWSQDAHSCARKKDGSVWCWGSNFYHNIQDSSSKSISSPVQRKEATGASFATGAYGTVCWEIKSKAWCAGGNGYGQLGKGSNGADQYTGVEVSGPKGVSWIDGGYDFHGLLSTTGSLWGVGHNSKGQLGVGGTSDSYKWVQAKLPAGTVVVQFDAVHDTTCIVTSLGAVLCSGDNSKGQLGNGNITGSSNFVVVLAP